MNLPSFVPEEFLEKKTYARLLYLAIFSLGVVGLYSSLKTVLIFFGVEPDTSHSIMLWQGFRSYGINGFLDWNFTSDNWLLSLVPFNFLGFAVFGPKPVVSIILGWLIFILSVILAGSIAWKLDAKKSSILIVVLLLNLGRSAHIYGFASYSTSHNITNLFGLFAIWLIIDWMRSPKFWHPIILTLALITGAVSDPWMLAAYNLPIFIVATLSLFRVMQLLSTQESFKLAISALISILASQTKLFGILYFLPSMIFQPANWDTLNENTIFLIKDLGGILNLIPIRLPVLSEQTSFLPPLISLLIIIGILQYLILQTFSLNAQTNKSKQLFLSISFFSVGGIITAFIINSVPTNLFSSRYLINCPYFILISICVLAENLWPSFSKKIKAFFLSIIFIFLIASIYSNLQSIKLRFFQINDGAVSETSKFLTNNGLTYGYGAYWGSNANAITAASNGEIIVRPIAFNPKTGEATFPNQWQTSKRWYLEGDAPKGTKEFFVIVKSHGEECPDIKLCLNSLSHQFGPPDRVLHTPGYYGGATIFVWKHRLIK